MGHDLVVVVESLNMVFSQEKERGPVTVLAPWLEEPIVAPTFEEAFWAAKKARHVPPAIPGVGDAE